MKLKGVEVKELEKKITNSKNMSLETKAKIIYSFVFSISIVDVQVGQ